MVRVGGRGGGRAGGGGRRGVEDSVWSLLFELSGFPKNLARLMQMATSTIHRLSGYGLLY